LEFFSIATKLRENNSAQYGIKGAKPGRPGYFKDGWKNSVEKAKEIYYRDTGKTPKKKEKKPSIIKDDETMDALYRGWLISLRQLKEKYHRAGLKDIKPRAPKRTPSSAAPKRLPPVIPPYGASLSSGQRLPLAPMARFPSSKINITKEDLERSQKMAEERQKEYLLCKIFLLKG